MSDAIQEFFLETVGREWCVFFCSMIPIIELRGAIPMGYLMGLEWWKTLLISIAGNMVPVPFILLFINKFIKFMSRSKVKFFNKLSNWLLGKVEKNRGKIEKYAMWGVTLFVAIPLPATGAWTGSLVAAAIDMKFWKAFLCAFVGVIIAGVIMTLVSYGGIAAIVGLFK
jgi:uncharacterized membrane protein